MKTADKELGIEIDIEENCKGKRLKLKMKIIKEYITIQKCTCIMDIINVICGYLRITLKNKILITLGFP